MPLRPGATQAAFNDAGAAGVYFCIGRYYGTVEIQCLFVSRVGGPDSMDFSALHALCARVVPRLPLETLVLTQNQLAGADPIGGGERNSAGLEQLLELLGADPPHRLTLLDLSRNLLSSPDASALLAAAIRSSDGGTQGLQMLRLDDWPVPVGLLARGCKGGARAPCP